MTEAVICIFGRPLAHMCDYHCTQLWYKMQHKNVLIIFSVDLQTVVIVQIMTTVGEEKYEHTHNRFTAGLEYVRVHPGQQVPER